MARPLRIEYEGAFYHVTSRGNERKDIFCALEDYERFKYYLIEAQDKYNFLLHGYVLMTNHYHLILETNKANLHQIMHYLNGSYTTYFNRTNGRTGHLFQGRYKGVVIDVDNYLLELSRYLHLNPVRAGMVERPEAYAYSSYPIDKIIRETTSLGTIDYSFSEVGRRKTMSVAGGPAINYRYDDANRLIEVKHPSLGLVSIDHDKAGRRTSLILPNGITTEYNYDKASRLLNMKHSTVSNVVENLTYTYDAAGNRISFGRINPQAELPKAVTAAYNVANQMLTFDDENLRYDANGNLIEKRDVNETTTYLWDARNRLIGINGPGLTATFKYDALGRRIEKTINGRTIQYLYDGIDIVAEIEEGVITATYLRSLYIDEVFARLDRNGIRYYQSDRLGSTVALTDQFGTPKTIYSYDPYGNTFISGEASDNPFQYTGRENDGTGLYYYRARYYSPELQRFISEDPIGFAGGLNFYAYVANNPVNESDPLGLLGPFGPGFKNVRWPAPNPYAPGPDTTFEDPNWVRMMSPCPTGGKAIPGQFSSTALVIGLAGGAKIGWDLYRSLIWVIRARIYGTPVPIYVPVPSEKPGET